MRTYRFTTSPAAARTIVEYMVDIPLKQHYSKCASLGIEDDCHHVESGRLEIARRIESGMRIGTRRAHLDLPDTANKPEEKKLYEALISYLDNLRLKRSGKRIERLAADIEVWMNKSPLERLAEVAQKIKLDE
jgi:hypothetical protein